MDESSCQGCTYSRSEGNRNRGIVAFSRIEMRASGIPISLVSSSYYTPPHRESVTALVGDNLFVPLGKMNK